jgi:hypothetical protein
MDELRWEERPTLRDPVAVMAFAGWFDAGSAATGAVEWLRDELDAELVAWIDPDGYFDFTQQRPEVEIVDGTRHIRWPRTEVWAAHLPQRDRDIVLVSGPEPHLRWRTYCQHLTSVATTFHSPMVVTLGSMVGGIPHTRPFSSQGSTTNDDLAALLGLDRPTYQGPTGVIGTLHLALEESAIPAISLRVAVPHYVSGPPNPKATRALLQRFELVTGITTSYADLDPSALEWEDRVSAAVAGDADVADYVRRLEEESDRATASDLPSGDDLAAEFERFLRHQPDPPADSGED